MARRLENLLDGTGSGSPNLGDTPRLTMPVQTPNASLPGSAPAPGAAPAAGAPVGPGLQGPYFQPGSGNDASSALAALDASHPKSEVPQFDDAFFGQLRNTLSGVVSGRDVPFTANLIRALKGNAMATAKDAATVGASEANSDALRRGVFRSAAGVNDAAAARDRAAASGVAATSQIDAQAAQANYNARMQGIQQGKALLDQLAERIRAREALGVDVSKARADLMLAYDRISAAERSEANQLNAALERQIVGATMGV